MKELILSMFHLCTLSQSYHIQTVHTCICRSTSLSPHSHSECINLNCILHSFYTFLSQSDLFLPIIFLYRSTSLLGCNVPYVVIIFDPKLLFHPLSIWQLQPHTTILPPPMLLLPAFCFCSLSLFIYSLMHCSLTSCSFTLSSSSIPRYLHLSFSTFLII